jgi:hypothetical protein
MKRPPPILRPVNPSADHLIAVSSNARLRPGPAFPGSFPRIPSLPRFPLKHDRSTPSPKLDQNLTKSLPFLCRQSQNSPLSFINLRQNFTVSLPFLKNFADSVHLRRFLARFSHFPPPFPAPTYGSPATCKSSDEKMGKFQFWLRNPILPHRIPRQYSEVPKSTLWSCKEPFGAVVFLPIPPMRSPSGHFGASWSHFPAPRRLFWAQ